MYAFNNSNFNVYWQDGASINSDREVEFIPQDYMISLADKDEDRNNLIRSIVKTDESNYKKIFNYEKSVQENKSIIRKLLEELETLNHQLANLRAPEGDKSGIEKQLRKIEAAIKEQSVQVNFSVERQKKYQQSYDNLKTENGKRLTELNLQDLASIKTKKSNYSSLSETDASDYNKQLTDF